MNKTIKFASLAGACLMTVVMAGCGSNNDDSSPANTTLDIGQGVNFDCNGKTGIYVSPDAKNGLVVIPNNSNCQNIKITILRNGTRSFLSGVVSFKCNGSDGVYQYTETGEIAVIPNDSVCPQG